MIVKVKMQLCALLMALACGGVGWAAPLHTATSRAPALQQHYREKLVQGRSETAEKGSPEEAFVLLALATAVPLLAFKFFFHDMEIVRKRPARTTDFFYRARLNDGANRPLRFFLR